MAAETLVRGRLSGNFGMKPGASIIGAPPTALRTLAAMVMCSISSMTTEWMMLAASAERLTIEKSAVR